MSGAAIRYIVRDPGYSLRRKHGSVYVMKRAAGTTPKGPRYAQLKAWAACHEMALQVHLETRTWPFRDALHLIDQARRASFSAAANIAEGAAKRGPREFRRFLDIALGSLAELSYALLLARDLGYLTPARWGEMEAVRDHAGQLTWGLYLVVSKRAQRTLASPP